MERNKSFFDKATKSKNIPSQENQTNTYNSTIVPFILYIYGAIGLYIFNISEHNSIISYIIYTILCSLACAIIISSFRYYKTDKNVYNRIIVGIFTLSIISITIVLIFSVSNQKDKVELNNNISVNIGLNNISLPYKKEGLILKGKIDNKHFEIIQKPYIKENISIIKP